MVALLETDAMVEHRLYIEYQMHYGIDQIECSRFLHLTCVVSSVTYCCPF